MNDETRAAEIEAPPARHGSQGAAASAAVTQESPAAHAPAARETKRGKSRRHLARWVTSDKTPFLLGLLLAALAWCVTRVADRAVALPIVEYEQISPSKLPRPIDSYSYCADSKGTQGYAYSIRNISKQVAFTNLDLYFYAPPKQVITETRWIDRPPGLAEPQMGPCSASKSNAMVLTLRELQPGWSGIALVWTRDSQPPTLVYKLRAPTDASTDARAVYLVQADLTTWVIRHEFDLYYASIVLLTVLVAWYGVIYATRE